jgi:hypothetical protein
MSSHGPGRAVLFVASGDQGKKKKKKKFPYVASKRILAR